MGVLGFIVLAFIVIFLVITSNKVGRLEDRVAQLESSGNSKKAGAPSARSTDVAAQLKTEKSSDSFSELQEQLSKSSESSAATGPAWGDSFGAWIKKDWLLKLGALLIIIAFGWLLTYAFANGWIGPKGRIGLGIFAGLGILVLGYWRMQKFANQGAVFLVLGSTVILMTVYAARDFYGFFTPLTALIVMFAGNAFVALAAVRYKARTLALVSLILAGVAPLLTGSDNPNMYGLFGYLMTVTLGTVWVVILTGWRSLTVAALAIVFAYSGAPMAMLTGSVDTSNALFYSPGSEPNQISAAIMVIFAFAFSAIFFITNTFGILKGKKDQIGADLITAGLNAIFLLSWIFVGVAQQWQSLTIVVWMLIFTGAGFSIFNITKNRTPMFAYTGVAIAFLAAATAAELHGASLTIAYIFEAALIPVVTHLILQDRHITEKLTLLMIGPAAFALASLLEVAARSTIIHPHFFVVVLFIAATFGMGLFIRELRRKDNALQQSIHPTFYVVGSIYAYILVWFVTHIGPNDDIGTLISLFIYTLIGIATYFYGMAKGKRGTKLYGGILVGLVIGRLLLVEVWDMNLVTRIITFFVIGGLLLATAFLEKGHKQQKS